MRTLYQRSKSGKIKFISLWTEDSFLCTKWGTTDSERHQGSRKECEPKNTGRTNATTAAEQAIIEMEAKIKKKTDAGYVDQLDSINETAVVDITLENLPKEFCPCKPISTGADGEKLPKKILNSPDTYGQRKRDGHCIILVRDESGTGRVYSRGMEDISEYMLVIPEVISMLSCVDSGSMILTEFCFVKDGKDNTRAISKIVRKKNKYEVIKRHAEAAQHGTFEIIPFDMMYSDGKFIGDLPYKERHTLMGDKQLPNIPLILENWQDMVEAAKEAKWEGFILRNDSNSKIHYSLNGKADKAGSYKYIFTKEDDFVVTGAEKGKAGKQTGLYAQFFLAQYLPDGTLLDSGKCGPGKLDHGRLAELTKEIDSGELQFPFTIQVEYRDRQPDSGKLTFPQFVEVRYDKKPAECVTDFELET